MSAGPKVAHFDRVEWSIIQDTATAAAAGQILPPGAQAGDLLHELLEVVDFTQFTVRPVEESLAEGHDVLLELDVQGMRSIKRLRPDAASIFILPPSLSELERRLRARADLSEEQLALRLHNATLEMAAQEEYDYIVYNGDLNKAVRDFQLVLRQIRDQSPHPKPL